MWRVEEAKQIARQFKTAAEIIACLFGISFVILSLTIAANSCEHVPEKCKDTIRELKYHGVCPAGAKGEIKIVEGKKFFVCTCPPLTESKKDAQTPDN